MKETDSKPFKIYRGKELDELMEHLEREELKKYKNYKFDNVANLLEEEVDKSHRYAFQGISKCRKFKGIQSKSNYILNLQSMINENLRLASRRYFSCWSIVRKECYELAWNSYGQIVPQFTIRTEIPDGEYFVSLNDWKDDYAINCDQTYTKNKIKINNGLFDIASVFNAADELISLFDVDRTMYIEDVSQVDKSSLNISMGT